MTLLGRELGGDPHRTSERFKTIFVLLGSVCPSHLHLNAVTTATSQVCLQGGTVPGCARGGSLGDRPLKLSSAFQHWRILMHLDPFNSPGCPT